MKETKTITKLTICLITFCVHSNTSMADTARKDRLDLDSSYDPSLGFGGSPTRATSTSDKVKTQAKPAMKTAKTTKAASSRRATGPRKMSVRPTKSKPAATVVAKSRPRDAARPMIKPRFANKLARQRLTTAASPTLEARIDDLRRRYRSGEINDRRMWQELASLPTGGQGLSTRARAEVIQTQAYLLKEAGYPITAAQYAAAALTTASDPLQKEMLPTWTTLAAISKTRSVQDTLIALAGTLDVSRGRVPEFGNDWHYFVGNAADRRGEKDRALDAFSRLAISDRYFMPGRYQLAMIQLERNHHREAEAILKSILYPETQGLSPLRGATKVDLENYTRIALARIAYERQDFLEAIRMYRLIDRDSALFYDTLFEQAWAFFMGGYPNHALGAVFSVESPFFADEFNPEVTMLRAIAHYWLCRYDDSRSALADFMERHSKAVESVATFLERRQLREETAYQLFENYVAGVSEEALGIPKAVLDTAARKDSMLLVRNEYAEAIAERSRLLTKGVFGNKENLGKPLELIGGVVEGLRRDLGATYLGEIKALKEQYDQLYAQAKFLYLELLMSEKEQLLGRELHASTKITQVDMRRDVTGWGRKLQSWGASDKGEFWWDEIGFYISKVEPMCNVK